MKVAIKVPLLDLKAQHETMREDIAEAIAEVVDSQWFIMGPNVSALEEEVAAYVGLTVMSSRHNSYQPPVLHYKIYEDDK